MLEQTTVDGKVGERLVEEHPLETAAADGTARKTLKLAKGGRYVLRAEGTDRFKNPITGQYTRADLRRRGPACGCGSWPTSTRYKVGDTATVKLHWREEPALALVTFQGARVLDYKLVELKKGANELDDPDDRELAPNFELAVAVMTDREGGRGEEPASQGRGEKKTDEKRRCASRSHRRQARSSRSRSQEADRAVP